MTKKNLSQPAHLPSYIDQLTAAIKCDNRDTTHLLVQQIMRAAYPQKSSLYSKTWNEQELDTVIALIKSMNPQDMIELILVAQFISLHLQSSANIAQENYNTMHYGLQMMRLSHQSLDMLQRYRGKHQTINVNYNVANQGTATLNTVIQHTEGGSMQKGR